MSATRNRPERARPRARWFREDVLAWFLFATLGSSLAVAAHLWLHRRVLPGDRALGGAGDDAQILVLAFDRIVTEPVPGKISRDELRRYLTALRDHGFVAVSLAELRGFYEREEPLPEKSVLLTFDHGYLSTYVAADPVLRELRWPGVLFVMTARQEQRDPFFVYWDRVSRMIASGVWELGSHGHRGHDPVPVDDEGAEGPFFIRARWLEERARAETWEEFAERVDSDHRRALRLVEEHTGKELLAYAPPLRDVAGLSAAPEAHQSTDRIVHSLYRLAFFDDRFGINDRRSDPKRLKRLRVEPSWSPGELLRRVTHSMADVPGTGTGVDAWVTGSGEARLEGSDLVVSGFDRADLWRAGSQRFDDWELECDFQIAGRTEGQLWVVQESDHGLEQWRLGGTKDRLYLQIRSPGERTDVVESYEASIDGGGWHHLRLVKRGLGIVAELDSEPLGEHPSFLPGRWRGNVGLVYWSPGQAELRLRNLRLEEVPFEAHVVSSSLSAEEVQSAIAGARRIAALSPRLLEVDALGFRWNATDDALLGLLSRRFAWEIVPTVVVSGDDASSVAAQLSEALSTLPRGELTGLRVEWGSIAASARIRVASTLEAMARELSWKRGRLRVAEDEVNP